MIASWSLARCAFSSLSMLSKSTDTCCSTAVSLSILESVPMPIFSQMSSRHWRVVLTVFCILTSISTAASLNTQTVYNLYYKGRESQKFLSHMLLHSNVGIRYLNIMQKIYKLIGTCHSKQKHYNIWSLKYYTIMILPYKSWVWNWLSSD